MGKLSLKARQQSERPEEVRVRRYLKSIEPQVAKTALDEKFKSEEYKQCSPCITILYVSLTLCFGLTTARVDKEIKSGKEAIEAFDEAWERFVECWNDEAETPATQAELEELKMSFTSSLEKDIDDVIKSQNTSSKISEKKLKKRQEKEEQNEAKKQAKREAKEATKTAKK